MNPTQEAATAVRAPWSEAPCPVLTVDADNTLVFVNEVAGLLFPDARPGASMSDAVPARLSDAHARCLTPAPAGPVVRD
ncbi:hypothetical protein [Streptomyces sp. cmx-4-9]|uniref:hypothetical protein n=1 Tax=Streptomyces sp. cmx-4-9 TaxID=2790941 RepID=UPI00397EBD66